MATWRTSREYRIWKVAVIRRDKVCQLCGSTQSRNAHHIEDASYHPESRFDPENGVCLCRSCHVAFHCDFKRSFREKCTKRDWNNFVKLSNYLRTKDIRKLKYV
jgi:predicted restriction endonuclease